MIVATETDTPRPVVERMMRPPLRDGAFWIIQATVLAIVGLHYFLDIHPSLAGNALPTGVPVAILVIPIGYAALRYGLPGSAATTLWTVILWLPDLMLPHDEGHAGDDLINFGIIILVAVIFGRRVEAERLAQTRADAATARTLTVEAGYRRLFESSRSPIAVLDDTGRVLEANPAATELLGPATGRPIHEVLGAPDETLRTGSSLTLANGHDYRLEVAALPPSDDDRRLQITLEDVTAERSEERRARAFAQQVIALEEDQRRRLARELHDEPLQLFLHLARRLESLGASEGVPGSVAGALAEARNQALDAATRLRTLARDLRPPALDQLGLVPALSSLVADVEDQLGVTVSFTVDGPPARLDPDVELGAFRIVQESLRNAERHAHAAHVRVHLDFRPDSLGLTIVDDGQGFDVDHAPRVAGPTTSLGLTGMHERARLLGGTLRVLSTPGVGTTVEATLPRHVAPTGPEATAVRG